MQAGKAEMVEAIVLARLGDAVLSIHDGEAAAMLWYCNTNGVQLPEQMVKSVLERMSPVCKIMALDAHIRTKGKAGMAALGLGPVTDEDLRGEDWLFHYERFAHGWTPGVGITGASNPWAALKADNFHFYRKDVAMPSNVPAQDDEDDDDNVFDFNDLDSTYF